MTSPSMPSLLFDLDGTLVDSVYQHVSAWQEVLRRSRISIPAVRIHRSVGMSGKLMLRTLFAEAKIRSRPRTIDALERAHKNKFQEDIPTVQVLPGAVELLTFLSRVHIRWAIATSGDRKAVSRLLRPLRLPEKACVVTGDDVAQAKPHPDVFQEAAKRLGVPLADCTVVGDSIWDMLAAQRAKALGVGLLTGGYSPQELTGAGAFRIYKDPAELLSHIAELGVIQY